MTDPSPRSEIAPYLSAFALATAAAKLISLAPRVAVEIDEAAHLSQLPNSYLVGLLAIPPDPAELARRQVERPDHPDAIPVNAVRLIPFAPHNEPVLIIRCCAELLSVATAQLEGGWPERPPGAPPPTEDEIADRNALRLAMVRAIGTAHAALTTLDTSTTQ